MCGIFSVLEEKEEEEVEDTGLDDWEAMVSDEDREKGGFGFFVCFLD